MFDRFYCIKKCHSKTLEKIVQTVFFSVPIMAREGTLPANVLTLLPGQMMTSFLDEITLILLCTLLIMTSDFVKAPECFSLTTEPCINNT